MPYTTGQVVTLHTYSTSTHSIYGLTSGEDKLLNMASVTVSVCLFFRRLLNGKN
jgi:hypothetical protein